MTQLFYFSQTHTFSNTMNAGHFEFVDSHTGKSILDFENKKPISVQGEFDSKSLETNIIHTSKVNNKNIKFVLNVSLLL